MRDVGAVAEQLAPVFALLAAEGQRDYIGEDVSQLEHALQCAHFAHAAGADAALVLAALFHDIGHLCAPPGTPDMDGLGAVAHEDLGAVYLRRLGFDERVAHLVGGHVAAKRYLAGKRPSYRHALSDASRHTLVAQGGPMSTEEAAAFERHPLFRDMLRLRQWDEMAKQVGLHTGDLDTYRALAHDYLLRMTGAEDTK